MYETKKGQNMYTTYNIIFTLIYWPLLYVHILQHVI